MSVTARNQWDSIIPFEPLWNQYERIIKDNGAIVLTCTFPFTAQLYNSNPKLFKYDLVWEKSIPTGYLNSNRMPMRYHENILVFYKNLPVYNKQYWYSTPYISDSTNRDKNSTNWGKVNAGSITDRSDGRREPRSIITVPSIREKDMHPTQKPVELMEYLIKTYTNPDELVLDSCAGSGTTCVAAINTGRRYIGIELDEVYYNKAIDRVANTAIQLGLGI